MIMKKTSLIVLAGGLVLLTTGCGGKTLNCKISEDGNKAEVSFKFDKNETLESASITATIKGDSSEFEEYSKFLEGGAEFKMDGIELKLKDAKNDKYTVTGKVNINKLNDAMKDTIDEELGDLDMDTVSDTLEEEGFTCK